MFLKSDMYFHTLYVKRASNCYIRLFSTMIHLTRILNSKTNLSVRAFATKTLFAKSGINPTD